MATCTICSSGNQADRKSVWPGIIRCCLLNHSHCRNRSCFQPLVTLDGSISYTFPTEGMHPVTVQVAVANTILQDTKTVAVKGQQYILLGRNVFRTVAAVSVSAECDAIWNEALGPASICEERWFITSGWAGVKAVTFSNYLQAHLLHLATGGEQWGQGGEKASHFLPLPSSVNYLKLNVEQNDSWQSSRRITPRDVSE